MKVSEKQAKCSSCNKNISEGVAYKKVGDPDGTNVCKVCAMLQRGINMITYAVKDGWVAVNL